MTSATEQTGVELRDEALEGLKKRHKSIVRQCQRLVVQIVMTGVTITADDLEHVDSGKKKRGFIGAVFKWLHREGVIRFEGYQPAKVARKHARPVGVWGCADIDRARAWLNDNPELDHV